MIQPLYTSGFVGGNPVSSFLTGRWIHHSQSASSPIPVAGTIRNWRLAYAAPPRGNKDATLKIYKNGVATALTITIKQNETTGADLSHSVTVAAGDLIDVRYSATGGDSFLWYASVIEWIPDDGVTAIYGYAQNATPNWSSSVTQYDGGFFGGGLGTTEANESSYVGSTSGGDVTKHYFVLNAAPGSGKSRAFTLIVNGTAQDGTGGTPNTTVTIANAATTGSASFTLTIAPGDLVSGRMVPTGSPPPAGGAGGIAFVPGTAGQCPIGMDAGVLSSAGTSYAPVTGGYAGSTAVWSTTEAALGSVRPIGSFSPGELSGMSARLVAAPGTGKSRVYTLIKNGAATAQTLTLADSDTVATTAGDPVSIGLGDTFAIREVRSGVPAGTTVKITFYLTPTGDTPIVGAAVFGMTTDVSANLAIAFGLYGAENLLDIPK